MKNYIPKRKGDIEAVKKLQSLPIEVVREDVPKLLEWMQDMNWEVGGYIADYFVPYIDYILTDLLTILMGNDDPWKYEILNALIARSINRPADELMAVINRIADNPTTIEKEESVDIIAKEIVKKFA
ncbi:DUF5071 domain-containing protein [Mucilaginibacter flavus]|uniref:DUF5071 domain-containing protein n=1 Tax=Mucilaginibacter flavus TaxID=931504 RepID=UPI0025B507CB|nr:DUF5071 domain-containing protein [Mucilaginibacter flavus]MDN3580541.1 DUF5071 domain-containing protein [Mucilaginibacter flavus]